MTDPFLTPNPVDFALRIAAVGIFITENINHASNFYFEVEKIVLPAVHPLPIELAAAIHALTILIGLSGALIVCYVNV